TFPLPFPARSRSGTGTGAGTSTGTGTGRGRESLPRPRPRPGPLKPSRRDRPEVPLQQQRAVVQLVARDDEGDGAHDEAVAGRGALTRERLGRQAAEQRDG